MMIIFLNIEFAFILSIHQSYCDVLDRNKLLKYKHKNGV